jgi:Protein of unknown function (DUF3052)
VAEKDYSHRDVVDKLGVKPGHAVVLVGPPPPELRQKVLERTGRPTAADDEPADVVLVWADASTDALKTLQAWKTRIDPSGGIWLLTPKRSQPGYVDQNDLIAAGKQAGVVDNKICSVSDTTSAMRFVIRKADRPRTVY